MIRRVVTVMAFAALLAPQALRPQADTTLLLDVNLDGRVDARDAAALYYAYDGPRSSLLSGNTAQARLLRSVWLSDWVRPGDQSDPFYLEMLRCADALRRVTSLDVNLDGRRDVRDVLVLYHAYEESRADLLLGEADSAPLFRATWLLRLVEPGDRNDPFYVAMLERAEALRTAVTVPLAVATGPGSPVADGETVTLDGTGSVADPKGRSGPLAYAWTQTGPVVGSTVTPTVALSDAAAARPVFTAPEVPEGERVELEFSLVVTNAQGGSSDAATVRVTVAGENDVPRAVVTATPGATHEGGMVRLDGTGSADPEGESLTYVWRQTGGPTVDLSGLPAFPGSDPMSAVLTFTAPDVDARAVLEFELEVSDGVGSAASTVEITVAPITLSLSPEMVVEDAAQPVTVTATLGGGVTLASRVELTVTVGGGASTATSGTDYAAVGDFTLEIPAESSSGTAPFDLTPTDDAMYEGDEGIEVAAVFGGLTVARAPLTLTENDIEPDMIALSVNPVEVGEGAGETAVTVTAALDGAVTLVRDTVVTVMVREDSAVSGADYAAVSDFTVTIPAGASSGMAPFDLTPIDDAVFEGPETLTVSGAATDFTVSAAQLTLADNEALGPDMIGLTVDPPTLGEDADATDVTVTATLGGSVTLATETVVTVTVGGAGSTATSGTDYAAVGGFTVTIPAESSSGTAAPFSLDPTDDAVYEGNELIAVSGTATDFTVSAAQITLTENDIEPTGIALSLNPPHVGGGRRGDGCDGDRDAGRWQRDAAGGDSGDGDGGGHGRQRGGGRGLRGGG